HDDHASPPTPSSSGQQSPKKPLAIRIPQRSASGASESNSSSGRGAPAQNRCTASSRWRGLVIGVPLRASRISIQGHRAVISAGGARAGDDPAPPEGSRGGAAL